MTATMPRARANTALAAGRPGTRVGYVPIPSPEPFYYPTKGAHFGNRLIVRRPQALVRARRRAAAWLASADPRTEPGFVFMADFWGALNDHIEPRGEMALFMRHNHI